MAGHQQAGALPAGGQGQPATLLRRCAAIPWHQLPVADRTRDRAHGRVELHTLKIVSVHAQQLGFPHAAQVIQVTRTTRQLHASGCGAVTVYATTSLPFRLGRPARLADRNPLKARRSPGLRRVDAAPTAPLGLTYLAEQNVRPPLLMAKCRQASLRSDRPFTVADLRTGERKEVPTLPWKAEKQGAGEPPNGRLWSVTSTSGLGASAAFDGTVTLWDVERRQALGTVRVPGAFDYSHLTFDPKGRRLAVATAGGAMSFVEVTSDAWRAPACTLAARDFSTDERRLHLGGQEVPRACP